MWGIFISFSVIFNKELHALEGLLYHNFSTYKASALGGFAPPRGSAPWAPEVVLPPLTIYPGVAPVGECTMACVYCGVSGTKLK